ncbi:MAG TPA: glutathione S-transferase family protein [Caulobacteraceae bacterium]|jgi:tetrachloro-p-hydroquinone reductive dehalogenase
MTQADAATDGLTLYHAPSSYYSMIARLSLAEAGLAYRPVYMDIHLRASQQQPAYARLNPNMTVPTLVRPGQALDQSRAIAEFAFGLPDVALDAETRGWLDLHYGYPIEELTFGGLLARNPVARLMIPKVLARSHRRLLALAPANPDLAPLYRARAEVFAGRVRTFDPQQVQALSLARRAQAIGFLDRLEANFADRRQTIVAAGYGVADAVWTVFLGRMEFAGLGAEVARRPALARYWAAMQARASFAAADIWTRMDLGRLLGAILWPPK